MNTAEILRAAAARVRQRWWQDGESHRWYRWNFLAPLGECAYIAINSVTSGARGEEGPACDALCRVLDVSSIGDVYRWNDAKTQTAENVALTLEYAALCWEQEQQHTAAPSAAESLVPCNRS